MRHRLEPTYRNNGITILPKFDPSKRDTQRPSRVALVLAGGAITGGAFKAGGLRALNETLAGRHTTSGFSSFQLTDFDLFVGLSAGSVIASALAAGISPEEIYRITTGDSQLYQPMRPLDFMRPNFFELPERALLFANKCKEIVGSYLAKNQNPKTQKAFSLVETLLKLSTVATRLAPTGLFDASGVRDYMSRQIQAAGLPNNFQGLLQEKNKGLYVTAVDINTGGQLVFGPGEKYADVPISEAISASCGLPGWYRTVRLKNPLRAQEHEREYLDLADGGLVRTANVGLAIKRGAELVIVYNPFTPIRYATANRSLYEHGAYALLSQIFRAVLGSRLDIGKEKIMFDPSAQADVIYIEPSGQDLEFFEMNPLNFWSKRRAALHGYQSVKAALSANDEALRPIFARHGIELMPSGALRQHPTPAM
jgi:NTE family protein